MFPSKKVSRNQKCAPRGTFFVKIFAYIIFFLYLCSRKSFEKCVALYKKSVGKCVSINKKSYQKGVIFAKKSL
jgi:hypothetical protein